MNKNELLFIIRAQNQASQAFASVSQSLRQLAKDAAFAERALNNFSSVSVASGAKMAAAFRANALTITSASTALQNFQKNFNSAAFGSPFAAFIKGGQATETLLDRLSRNTRAFHGFVNQLAVALGLLFAGAGLVKLIDTTTEMDNQIRLVTKTTEELEHSFDSLTAISKETRVALDANVDVFRRIGVATEKLGTPLETRLELVRSLNQALIISGSGAQEARAGLIQFAQGLSSNRLQGDELRSVLENIPKLAQVLAASFKNGLTGLRDFARQGKITTEFMLDAIKRAREELATQFKLITPTVEQSITVFRTSLLVFLRDLNKAQGVGAALSKGILFLADNIQYLAVAFAAVAFVIGGLLLAEVVALAAAFAATPFGAMVVGVTALAVAMTALGFSFDEIIKTVTVLGKVLIALGAGIAVVWLLNTAITVISGSIRILSTVMKGLAAVQAVIAALAAPWVLIVGAVVAVVAALWLFKDELNNLPAGAAKVTDYIYAYFAVMNARILDLWDSLKGAWAVVMYTMGAITEKELENITAKMKQQIDGRKLITVENLVNEQVFQRAQKKAQELGISVREALDIELGKKGVDETLAERVRKQLEEIRKVFGEGTIDTGGDDKEGEKRIKRIMREIEQMREKAETLKILSTLEERHKEIAEVQAELLLAKNEQEVSLLLEKLRVTQDLVMYQQQLDAKQELEDLQDKAFVMNQYLSGQARSLEIAEKQLAITRALSPLEKERINDQIKMINVTDRLNAEVQAQEQLQRGVASAVKDTFKDFIKGADSALDILGRLADKLADLALESAFVPLEAQFAQSNIFGSLFGGFFGSAKGNVFNRGNLVPYAAGGVVGSPTIFPMRGGKTGLMGEAGPEAIMPLTRLSSGQLGVRADGAGGGTRIIQMPINVEVNVDNAGGDLGDPETARKLGTQIAATVESSFYKLVDKESRIGGRLEGAGRR